MKKQTAEQSFYAAFSRLKSDTPQILHKGTVVSQNNVAREAGCDPSALRKSRYPSLVRDIQQWVSENSDLPQSDRQATIKRRKQNRSLRDEINEIKKERDNAMSLLLEADARIFELYVENQRLQAGMPSTNILPMRYPGSQ